MRERRSPTTRHTHALRHRAGDLYDFSAEEDDLLESSSDEGSQADRDRTSSADREPGLFSTSLSQDFLALFSA